MFSCENHVRIAADHVERLRRSDVFRLLDSILPLHQKIFVLWLRKKRPDLVPEIDSCLAELKEEEIKEARLADEELRGYCCPLCNKPCDPAEQVHHACTLNEQYLADRS